MATKPEVKVLATNRKAQRDYFVLDRLEAGLVLRGSEIKSARAGHVNLAEAYVRDDRNELWLANAHIAQYDPASRDNHDPLRPRKLLLHRDEIARLRDRVQQKGLTIIPLRMYLSKGRAKVEIALARGKKSYDKRQAISRRENEREIARAVAARGKGQE
jgi:SsrA-binding protein